MILNEEEDKKVQALLDSVYEYNPQGYDAIVEQVKKLDEQNKPFAAYAALLSTSSPMVKRESPAAIREPSISFDPADSTGLNTDSEGNPKRFWKTMNDDELYRYVGALANDAAGGYDQQRMDNIKSSMQDATDRIVRRRNVDETYPWIVRKLAPHQMEDMYEGRDPSWKSFGLDLGFAALEMAPMAMPFGFVGSTMAKAGAKAIGSALTAVGANAAVPFIEEGLDALAYEANENAERAEFSMSDAVKGSIVNAAMPSILKRLGAGVGRVAPTAGRGIQRWVAGKDPGAMAQEVKEGLESTVSNFEKFNPASGTNTAGITEKIGTHNYRVFDDPLKINDGKFNVPGDPNYKEVAFSKSVLPESGVPTIEQAREAANLLEAIGAIENGSVKIKDLPNGQIKRIGGSDKYDNLLPELGRRGAIPIPSKVQRATSMALPTLVSNKAGSGSVGNTALKSVGNIDPTSWVADEGENGIVASAVESLQNDYDNTLIDELIAENAEQWEAGFRPWIGFNPSNPNDILVRAYKKWAASR